MKYENQFSYFFVHANEWREEEWAISLSALLTGEALEVYSRLSEEDGVSYRQLKKALLKRYNLTEDGYREKFRTCQPKYSETKEQLIFRVKRTLKSGSNYEGQKQRMRVGTGN